MPPTPMQRLFVVTLHDTAPAVEREILRQRDLLAPLVGDTLSAAIIPAPAGEDWGAGARTLRAALAGMERLLHGHRHRTTRPRGLLARCCGQANEFTGLPAAEARDRLRAGQGILAELFGRPASGFLPPAWQAGPVDARIRRECGLHFAVGYSKLHLANGPGRNLATFTWDFGPAATLGLAGTPLGLAFRRRTGAIPVIALHPCDERRGFLRAAMERTRRLLGEGYEPTTFASLAENGA